MTAAICCPGPSLAAVAVTDLAGYDTTIGVNRASIALPVEWAAINDYPLFKKIHDRLAGAPNLLSRRQTVADLRGRLARFPQIALVEEIEMPAELGWRVKTMTCAMAFAYSRGHHVIDIYGCDWTGTADFDGTQAGEDRSEARCNQERLDYEKLVRWLARRNVLVTRKVPSSFALGPRSPN